MGTWRITAIGLTLLGLLNAHHATAQTPAAQAAPLTTVLGQPPQVTLSGQAGRLAGWGEARFGMTPQQVRAAAEAQFGPAWAAALQSASTEDPEFPLALEGRLAADHRMAKARVLYAFDRDQRLAWIGMWRSTEPKASDADRAELAVAAQAWVSELLAYRWRAFSTARGVVLSDREVVVLSASDDVGNGVEVRLSNMAFQAVLPDGTRRKVHAPAEAAVLRVLFKQDIDNLAVIAPGAF